MHYLAAKKAKPLLINQSRLPKRMHQFRVSWRPPGLILAGRLSRYLPKKPMTHQMRLPHSLQMTRYFPFFETQLHPQPMVTLTKSYPHLFRQRWRTSLHHHRSYKWIRKRIHSFQAVLSLKALHFDNSVQESSPSRLLVLGESMGQKQCLHPSLLHLHRLRKPCSIQTRPLTSTPPMPDSDGLQNSLQTLAIVRMFRHSTAELSMSIPDSQTRKRSSTCLIAPNVQLSAYQMLTLYGCKTKVTLCAYPEIPTTSVDTFSHAHQISY